MYKRTNKPGGALMKNEKERFLSLSVRSLRCALFWGGFSRTATTASGTTTRVALSRTRRPVALRGGSRGGAASSARSERPDVSTPTVKSIGGHRAVLRNGATEQLNPGVRVLCRIRREGDGARRERASKPRLGHAMIATTLRSLVESHRASRIHRWIVRFAFTLYLFS